MKCAWTSLLGILPIWMRKIVDAKYNDSLQEIRMRIGRHPELITKHDTVQINQIISTEDLSFCINAASRYSPWSAWTSKFGYLTVSGGHRIGICGQAIYRGAEISAISDITSLCIRVARDFEGLIADKRLLNGSVLIIGKPGSGKTTLLRDLIRFRSQYGDSSVTVVDEKQEIFPMENGKLCFPPGERTDIVSCCNKTWGIDALLRNMSPGTIAVDEITSSDDCIALSKAGYCGTDLLATAHAGSKTDLYKRSVYRPIIEANLFQHLIILQSDKSWISERICQ